MASFAQTLRSFSTGSISREDLFSSLENILSEKRVDTPWLLSVLDQEQENVSLPREVYDEVRLKVMAATDGDMNESTGNSALEADPPSEQDEDLSRTQVATSYIQRQEDDSNVTTSSDRQPAKLGGAVEVDFTIKGVGDVLNGRFVLEERVGAGGMSTVYRALDRRKLEADDRDPYIAVKILNVEFRSHPDSLIALQREAKKCHKLAHPNIVRAYDFDRDQATVYMTMEYLTGHSLAKILRDPGFKGMPCNDAMPIIRGMSDALAYAHKNGIVHADFKPANVILTDDGEVKVIDFGIARAFHKQGDNDTEATRFDPGSLGALTPTYASPEMLEHRDPDPRDDVYALACIVYELLTGRHPFGRRQANEARDGGLSLDRKTLTRRQWKALRRALEFDRDKRTPSIEQFYRDINPECTRVSGMGMVASVLLAVLLIGIGGVIFQHEISALFGTGGDAQTGHDGADTQTAAQTTISSIERGEVARQSSANPPVAKALEATSVVEEKAETTPLPVKETVTAAAKPALSGEALLQAIRGQLSTYECSAMSASMNGGEINIAGYLSDSIPLSALKRGLPGASGNVVLKYDITPVKKTMCAIVDVYKPFWIGNRENDLGTSILPQSGNGEFTGGEPLVVKLTTPGYSTFVNVDYYSLDGHVVHMLPSQLVRGNQAPANYSATLGDLGQWIVSEPYGRELIVILTAPKPLFTGLRKEYESAADYTKALNARLAAVDDDSIRRKIAADFVFINTRPKR